MRHLHTHTGAPSRAAVSESYWKAMLAAVTPAGALHAVTVHDYGADCAGDVSALGLVLNVTCLDAMPAGAAAVAALAAPFGVPVWNGESAFVGSSGADGVTNTFVSTLFYANELGSYARAGVALVARQTLVGGDYELVNKSTFKPNPDYYALLLWRRLVGGAVLPTSTSDPAAPVRAYSHCAAPGAAAGNGSTTTVLINFSLGAAYLATLEWPAPLAPGETVDVYQLAPLAGRARGDAGGGGPAPGAPSTWYRVALNGAEVLFVPGGPLPPLPPALQPAAGGVLLPPATVTFVVRHGAGAPSCT